MAGKLGFALTTFEFCAEWSGMWREVKRLMIAKVRFRAFCEKQDLNSRKSSNCRLAASQCTIDFIEPCGMRTFNT